VSGDSTAGGGTFAPLPIGMQVVAYGVGIDPMAPGVPRVPWDQPVPDGIPVDAWLRALERLRMEPDALAREVRELKELVMAMHREKLGSPLLLIKKLAENMIAADPGAIDVIEAVCKEARETAWREANR
jgi:hypothetical protein